MMGLITFAEANRSYLTAKHIAEAAEDYAQRKILRALVATADMRIREALANGHSNTSVCYILPEHKEEALALLAKALPGFTFKYNKSPAEGSPNIEIRAWWNA